MYLILYVLFKFKFYCNQLLVLFFFHSVKRLDLLLGKRYIKVLLLLLLLLLLLIIIIIIVIIIITCRNRNPTNFCFGIQNPGVCNQEYSS